MKSENMIYVNVIENNKAILKFQKCHIETNAFIGKNGATIHKKEGDKKTPIGEFELGMILGTHFENFFSNQLKVCYIQITDNLYWIDDPISKYYNMLVDISKVTKDWKSAEHLIEYPISYEYLIEIKTNPNNIPGKGSAIFLHCIDKGTTAGCVAVDSKMMKKIIENIDEQTKIKIYNEN